VVTFFFPPPFLLDLVRWVVGGFGSAFMVRENFVKAVLAMWGSVVQCSMILLRVENESRCQHN